MKCKRTACKVKLRKYAYRVGSEYPLCKGCAQVTAWIKWLKVSRRELHDTRR